MLVDSLNSIFDNNLKADLPGPRSIQQSIYGANPQTTSAGKLNCEFKAPMDNDLPLFQVRASRERGTADTDMGLTQGGRWVKTEHTVVV